MKLTNTLQTCSHFSNFAVPFKSCSYFSNFAVTFQILQPYVEFCGHFSNFAIKSGHLKLMERHLYTHNAVFHFKEINLCSENDCNTTRSEDGCFT